MLFAVIRLLRPRKPTCFDSTHDFDGKNRPIRGGFCGSCNVRWESETEGRGYGLHMGDLSAAVIPIFLALAGAAMCFSKKPLFDAFKEGVREGVGSCVGLFPTLLGLLVCISMFQASGAADWLASLLSSVLSSVGIPPELTPLLLVRPVSGSASTALASELLEKYGADSFVGRCLSVILGSSDTMLYVVAVYLGSVGVNKSRHTIPAAAVTMLFCVLVSCLIVRWYWG